MTKTHYNYSLTTAPVSKEGESPLALALHEKKFEVIKYLVEEFSVNINGESSVVGIAVCHFITV